MEKLNHYTIRQNERLSIVLMLFLIAIPYSNSLLNSWHLDDVINILLNTRLHLTTLSLSDLIKTFFAYPTHPGRFYRPISCLSLALNWFFSQDDTTGYHLVNVSIHLLTSFFLYKTILLLFNSPRLNGRYQGHEHFIAMLTTIFWAVNPVQTQAVTYIIQRMASLSALFYLLGLYFYINGRNTALNRKEKFSHFLLTILSFLFALGSKENSILFPFSVLLIELIFFSTSKISRKNIVYFLGGITALFGLSAFLFTNGDILQILTSYHNRNFTLWQRLLTESRVVVWYLTLIFYPSVTRLSLEHDFQLSTSLFSPATTLPAILFLLTLSFAGFLGYKKFPIPAFAILFFLLNHLVESTILPLELVFEHRNYLPTLFLFWPVAILAVQLLSRYREKPVMHGIIVVFLSLLMSSLAMGTFIRNQVWYSEKTLWTDAVTKAPNSMRALLDLAYAYEYENDLQTAFLLDQRALSKVSPTLNKFTVIAYNNMGNIMRKMGRNQDALHFYDKGLALDHNNKDVLFNKFLAQQADSDQTGAKQTLTLLLQQAPQDSRYLIGYANIEINEGTPEKAMKTLRKALAASTLSDPSSWQSLLSLSLASNKMNQFNKALFYIHLAKNRGAPDFLVGLCALENHILKKSPDSPEQQLKMIFSNAPLTELRKKFVFGLDNNASIALDKKLILDYIDNWIRNQIATKTKEPTAAP